MAERYRPTAINNVRSKSITGVVYINSRCARTVPSALAELLLHNPYGVIITDFSTFITTDGRPRSRGQGHKCKAKAKVNGTFPRPICRGEGQQNWPNNASQTNKIGQTSLTKTNITALRAMTITMMLITMETRRNIDSIIIRRLHTWKLSVRQTAGKGSVDGRSSLYSQLRASATVHTSSHKK